MSDCAICALDNLAEVEAASALAVQGQRSWSSLGQQFNVNRQSLKNHMERHWVAPVTATEQALGGLDAAIAQNIEELLGQMELVPPELKPFYAVAIQNLQALKDTKPSQQNLINALKAVHEVTGMRMEQQLMLTFARAKFGALASAEKPALGVGDLIDVDV